MEHASEMLREPIAIFVLLISVIFVIPPIFERFRIPGLVGLLAAGVCLGSSGLGWLNSNSEIMRLLSDIGKIYLMFIAGLEVDLDQFQKTRLRSMGFGGLTFIMPLLGGIAVGRFFGLNWNAAVLLGSLLSSHTLLAYPIVRRLGIVGNEAVTVTVGATIFTDIGSLLILAICLGVQAGQFSALSFLFLLGSLAAYAALVLWGIVKVGDIALAKFKGDETNQFLFVLCAVFLAAIGAELIGVEKIVGAFLAGLAVNHVLGRSPVKEKVEFIGMALFVPIFFVDMGLLLDLNAFRGLLSSIGLPIMIVVVLCLSKLVAAIAAKQLYRYTWLQTLLMWSLSLPQVAATLAAALTAYQAQIIGKDVFNSIVLLMLVTAVSGPILTTRFGEKLATESIFNTNEKYDANDWLTIDIRGTSDVVVGDFSERFSVVLPINSLRLESNLFELAALLTKPQKGRIIPLAVVKAQTQLNNPKLAQKIQYYQELLDQAEVLCEELKVDSEPTLRLASEPSSAINYFGRETETDLIMLSIPKNRRYGDRFSRLINNVLMSAHCSVLLASLVAPPETFKNILVPLSNFSPSALRSLRLGLILAQQNSAHITLLHVCNPSFPADRVELLKQHLTLRLKDLITSSSIESSVQVIPNWNIVETIEKVARQHDLVILQSERKSSGIDNLVFGRRTMPILQRLRNSVILLGEPQERYSSITTNAISKKIAA